MTLPSLNELNNPVAFILPSAITVEYIRYRSRPSPHRLRIRSPWRTVLAPWSAPARRTWSRGGHGVEVDMDSGWTWSGGGYGVGVDVEWRRIWGRRTWGGGKHSSGESQREPKDTEKGNLTYRVQNEKLIKFLAKVCLQLL